MKLFIVKCSIFINIFNWHGRRQMQCCSETVLEITTYIGFIFNSPLAELLFYHVSQFYWQKTFCRVGISINQWTGIISATNSCQEFITSSTAVFIFKQIHFGDFQDTNRDYVFVVTWAVQKARRRGSTSIFTF